MCQLVQEWLEGRFGPPSVALGNLKGGGGLQASILVLPRMWKIQLVEQQILRWSAVVQGSRLKPVDYDVWRNENARPLPPGHDIGSISHVLYSNKRAMCPLCQLHSSHATSTFPEDQSPWEHQHLFFQGLYVCGSGSHASCIDQIVQESFASCLVWKGNRYFYHWFRSLCQWSQSPHDWDILHEMQSARFLNDLLVLKEKRKTHSYIYKYLS